MYDDIPEREAEVGDRLAEETRAYGLEDRTFAFAKAVRAFVRTLPRTLSNVEDAKQLVRSSGSVGANFIEASEAISDKDYLLRLRISRKEAKESRYWLRLLYLEAEVDEKQRQNLIDEAKELVLILNALVNKHQRR